MLSGDVENVFRSVVGDGEVREIERLSVHVAIDGEGAELCEFRLIHVGGSEHGFVEVLPGAQVVVVIGGDVHTGGWRDGTYSECQRRW